MKKLISIISILFIAFNSFGQYVPANSGHVITTKVGGGVSQAYVDSLFSLGYTKAQVDSAIAANIGGGGGISQLGDGGYFLTKPNDSTYNFDSSHASTIYLRRKDSSVSYYSPYLLQSTYATIANMAKKYDSTQFIVNTTFLNDMQTNGSGFTNFNGATNSYDGTNKRLTVVAAGSTRGVLLNPISNLLTTGHTYTLKVNVTMGTVTNLKVQNKYGTNLFTIQNSGTYTYTFVADVADANARQSVYVLTNNASGTFYINYIIIQEVPADFAYATKGDIFSTPIIRYSYIDAGNIRIGINTNTYNQFQDITHGQIVIGDSSYAAGTETLSTVVGTNSRAYVDPAYGVVNGGQTVVGSNTIGGAWRATVYGANAQGLAVSTSVFGYGSYANAAHAQVYGRGGFNDLSNVTLFSGNTQVKDFYFNAIAAKFLNPAMPLGGELTDLSGFLNAGTQITSLRGVSGRDAMLTPTLTNTRGGTMRLAGGASTGTAAGGNVQLAVTLPGVTSNNTLNPDFVAVDVSAVDGTVKVNAIPTGVSSDSLLVVNGGTIKKRVSTAYLSPTDSTHPSLLKKNEKIDTSNLPITNIYTGRGTGHTNDSTIITMAHVFSQSSVSTLTINADTTDMAILTTQAVGLTIANPTGTPLDGQQLTIRIKDNGSSQTISFGSQFRFSSDDTAPTSTSSGKWLYLYQIWNSIDSKWDVQRIKNNF